MGYAVTRWPQEILKPGEGAKALNSYKYLAALQATVDENLKTILLLARLIDSQWIQSPVVSTCSCESSEFLLSRQYQPKLKRFGKCVAWTRFVEKLGARGCWTFCKPHCWPLLARMLSVSCFVLVPRVYILVGLPCMYMSGCLPLHIHLKVRSLRLRARRGCQLHLQLGGG
jgi:hypothetical protein